MAILLFPESAAAPPPEPDPLPSGLLAMYHMDEGSGEALVDSSGEGRNGTLGSTAGADTNDPTWTAAGLSFSTDDYVACGTNVALQPSAWTVCVATKLTPNVVNPVLGWHATAQLPGVFAAAPFNQNRPLIWLANNCFRYFEKSTPVNLHDGGWHFLVFTCPGNSAADIVTSALTIDGQAQAINSTTNTQDGVSKTTCRLGASGTAYFGSSETAFFALHGRVLTAGEQDQMRTYAKAVLAGRVTLP